MLDSTINFTLINQPPDIPLVSISKSIFVIFKWKCTILIFKSVQFAALLKFPVSWGIWDSSVLKANETLAFNFYLKNLKNINNINNIQHTILKYDSFMDSSALVWRVKRRIPWASSVVLLVLHLPWSYPLPSPTLWTILNLKKN